MDLLLELLLELLVKLLLVLLLELLLYVLYHVHIGGAKRPTYNYVINTYSSSRRGSTSRSDTKAALAAAPAAHTQKA